MRFSDGKSEHVSCLPSYILDPRALPARHKSSLFAPVFASVSVSEYFPSLFVFLVPVFPIWASHVAGAGADR